MFATAPGTLRAALLGLMLVKSKMESGTRCCLVATIPLRPCLPSLAGLGKLNDMLEGTALPRLSMEAMERIFDRNSVKLLGIDEYAAPASVSALQESVAC